MNSRGRTRKIEPISFEERERRALLQKDWARYRCEENRKDFLLIGRVFRAQQKALAELKLESEDLYQAAIQPDPSLVPLRVNGPVVTPAIENYAVPAKYRDNYSLRSPVGCVKFDPNLNVFIVDYNYRTAITPISARNGNKTDINHINRIRISLINCKNERETNKLKSISDFSFH